MKKSFWVRLFSNKLMQGFMALKGNQIVVLTFVFLISAGALLLMTPFATTDGQGLSWIDAYFTATSGSCVTGLTVVDVKNDLTFFGQLVLLFCIQAGGLSMTTFGTLLAVALGRKINLKERLVLQESLNQDEPQGVVKLTLKVVKYTFIIEAFFALILTWHFSRLGGFDSVWYGIFHSISGFCNAGFDLFGNYDSLVHYSDDVVLNLCIMTLIVLGGLGFPTMVDIFRQRHWSTLHLHSKLVLVGTSSFILGGALLLFALEHQNPATMGGHPFYEQMLMSFMQSISARTAGFNSVDLASLREISKLVLCFLMFVGACPSSTGGGIKITTFLVILLATWATLRGRQEPVVFGRRIGQDIVSKAMTVFTLSAVWVMIAFFGLLCVNYAHHPFSFVFFETISAFGTVGMGVGITNDWDTVGKLILIVTMFLGRVGIITFVLSLMEQKPDNISYPTSNITIG
jgi:trk system potassium uptake protein TrkH